MSKTTRTCLGLGLAVAQLGALSCRELFVCTVVSTDDHQPPYAGPGWRAAAGGAPPIDFPKKGVRLLSWVPQLEFDPIVPSANDCWGYVSPSGREYALIGLSIGTGFVEVTNPADAQIVSVTPGPNSTWRDIKVYQHYAYAVSDGGGGIQIFDLSEIDSGVVTLVNTVADGGRPQTHNVTINEESTYLYRVGGARAECSDAVKGLRIYSLANPENHAFVAEWSHRYCHDAQVVNWTQEPFAGREIAFCYANNTGGGGNPGIDILDVTNKTAISLIGSLDLSAPPIFPSRGVLASRLAVA